MAGILDIMPYCQIEELRSMRDIKRLFPEDYDIKNNWFFASLSGIHGTHLTIEEVEDKLHHGDNPPNKYWLTMLVIQPRLCNLYYGEIQVSLKDLPMLRQLVKNTLEVIPKTQKGNT